MDHHSLSGHCEFMGCKIYEQLAQTFFYYFFVKRENVHIVGIQEPQPTGQEFDSLFSPKKATPWVICSEICGPLTVAA